MNEDLNIDDIKLWSIMIESHFLIQHKKFIEVKALIFGVANWNHPHSSSFRMPMKSHLAASHLGHMHLNLFHGIKLLRLQ